MKFYYIKDEYINHLKRFDDSVADNKNATRPYIGIVMSIDGINYYAPLSSPKQKHQNMKNMKDFHKINAGIYGAINLNNMIPVTDSALIDLDIASITDVQYRRLLQNQYTYIKSDSKKIINKATKLRALIFTDEVNLTQNDISVKHRCCNLPLLEQHMYDCFWEDRL